jgi:hypothetical protein
MERVPTVYLEDSEDDAEISPYMDEDYMQAGQAMMNTSDWPDYEAPVPPPPPPTAPTGQGISLIGLVSACRNRITAEEVGQNVPPSLYASSLPARFWSHWDVREKNYTLTDESFVWRQVLHLPLDGILAATKADIRRLRLLVTLEEWLDPRLYPTRQVKLGYRRVTQGQHQQDSRVADDLFFYYCWSAIHRLARHRLAVWARLRKGGIINRLVAELADHVTFLEEEEIIWSSFEAFAFKQVARGCAALFQRTTTTNVLPTVTYIESIDYDEPDLAKVQFDKTWMAAWLNSQAKFGRRGVPVEWWYMWGQHMDERLDYVRSYKGFGVYELNELLRTENVEELLRDKLLMPDGVIYSEFWQDQMREEEERTWNAIDSFCKRFPEANAIIGRTTLLDCYKILFQNHECGRRLSPEYELAVDAATVGGIRDRLLPAALRELVYVYEMLWGVVVGASEFLRMFDFVEVGPLPLFMYPFLSWYHDLICRAGCIARKLFTSDRVPDGIWDLPPVIRYTGEGKPPLPASFEDNILTFICGWLYHFGFYDFGMALIATPAHFMFRVIHEGAIIPLAIKIQERYGERPNSSRHYLPMTGAPHFDAIEAAQLELRNASLLQYTNGDLDLQDFLAELQEDSRVWTPPQPVGNNDDDEQSPSVVSTEMGKYLRCLQHDVGIKLVRQGIRSFYRKDSDDLQTCLICIGYTVKREEASFWVIPDEGQPADICLVGQSYRDPSCHPTYHFGCLTQYLLVKARLDASPEFSVNRLRERFNIDVPYGADKITLLNGMSEGDQHRLMEEVLRATPQNLIICPVCNQQYRFCWNCRRLKTETGVSMKPYNIGRRGQLVRFLCSNCDS